MSKRPTRAKSEMKAEYDFSDGVRGKFNRPEMTLVPPIHLDPDVLAYLMERAKARKTTVSALVNELLKRDIDLIETVR